MELGSVASTPGDMTTGWLDVTDLPTEAPERFPVLIAEGTAATLLSGV